MFSSHRTSVESQSYRRLLLDQAGKAVELPVEEENIEVASVDELHTYVNKKSYRWIWIAVNRLGKRFLSFVCGDRSTATGLKLWEKLQGLSVCMFATDHWRSCEEFIPPEQHIQSKAETFTVEGYNSRSATTCHDSKEKQKVTASPKK